MAADTYIVNWIAVALSGLLGTGAIVAMFIASIVMAPRRPSTLKAIPYESGIIPAPHTWTQLHIRYYIFAILFLVFDVEAAFLFPWAIVFLRTARVVFYEMVIFLAVLLFGVMYAWKKGVLQWR